MTLEEEFRKRIEAASDLEELAKSLQELLSGPYSVWHDGRLYNIKVLVDKIKDLKIEIRLNDHPPPHFHVVCQRLNASFEIESGDLLEGQIDPRHYQLVKFWHRNAKLLLNKTWDSTRPGG